MKRFVVVQDSLKDSIKARSNEDESWWESMRVATLASVWPPTLIHSHQLSSTLINFELVQILMRVDKSLCAFDRSWELMRVAKVLAVCCKNVFKLLVVHSLQLWVSLILSSSIIFVCWPTPPANSHQLSSSFDRSIWELTKLSCELSPLNSHPRLTGPLLTNCRHAYLIYANKRKEIRVHVHNLQCMRKLFFVS